MLIKWMKFCGIKPEKIKSEQGFTLVEVILAFVVVSILSSSLVLPFLSNLNDGTRADLYANAAHIASMDIDDWRAGVFASIPLSTTPASTGGDITINGRAYVRTYVNIPVDETLAYAPGGDYVKVLATVTTTPNISVTLYGLISDDYN